MQVDADFFVYIGYTEHRGNRGGSTTYIYDFLLGVLGIEDIGYSHKYIQRCSELFLDYLKKENIEWDSEEKEIITEEYSPRIPNQKKMYVLIDEVTASAAEEGIAFLRNIENVSIVGKHSAGCGFKGDMSYEEFEKGVLVAKN